MPYADLVAASIVRAERERLGLSPEKLAEKIQQRAIREKWDPELGTINAYTIRRVEGIPGRDDRPGLVPGIRVKVVLGLFFEMPHTEIWKDAHRFKVIAPPPERAVLVGLPDRAIA